RFAAGKQAIQFTRRISGPDGRFAGVVGTSIDPDFLIRFYQSIDVGPHGLVSVVGNDGYIRARTHLVGEALQRSLELSLLATPMFTAAEAAGSYQVKSRIDGAEHLHSYRRLGAYPLVVNVGFGLDDVLAGYRRNLQTALPALAALSVVLA